MLRLVRFLATLWALVVMQTVVIPVVRIAGVGPDVTLLLVLMAGLFEGAAGGALAGFLVGLFVDLNSPGLLGLTSLANSLVGFAVGLIADSLVRQSATTRAALAVGAIVARDILLILFSQPDELFRELFRQILPAALYTAALAVPFMALVERAVGWREESSRVYR